jgi:2,3-diketo-5-methylthiopentyl-1-phosphate enolase
MSRPELVATYVADLPPGRELAAAEAFAIGQTIGTWVPIPGVTDEMRILHGGRVVEVREAGSSEIVAGEPANGRWIVRIGFPLTNFGPSWPMIFTTLLGNDPSTSLAARLLDVEIPASFAAAFPGPKFGVGGWRSLTGVEGRPLLLNVIKPCTGFPPAVGASFVRSVAAGGPDLIKDDELLADPDFARVRDRARAYATVLDEVADGTGQRPRYVANVTASGRHLEATARAALEGGADALMVNALAVGLDAFAGLVDSGPGVPIFAHTAGIEVFTGPAGFGHALMVGTLLRLAGADAILIPSPYGRRPLSHAAFHASADRMRGAWEDRRPSMPVVGGGLTAEHVPSLVDALGVDHIINVGGAVQGHPDGPAAGARTMLRAIESAVARRGAASSGDRWG